MVDLGVQIHALRKARGWSAQRLSDELGGLLSRYVISDLETGRKQHLDFRAGVALARVFDMTAEEFLDGDVTTAIRKADLEARLTELNSSLAQIQKELEQLS